MGSDASGRCQVNYQLRLRGTAVDLADAIVMLLKDTFSDRKKRRAFLDRYWEICEAEGLELRRKSKARSLKKHSSSRRVNRGKDGEGRRSRRRRQKQREREAQSEELVQKLKVG